MKHLKILKEKFFQRGQPVEIVEETEGGERFLLLIHWPCIQDEASPHMKVKVCGLLDHITGPK
jgi:hypothetical protein